MRHKSEIILFFLSLFECRWLNSNHFISSLWIDKADDLNYTTVKSRRVSTMPCSIYNWSVCINTWSCRHSFLPCFARQWYMRLSIVNFSHFVNFNITFVTKFWLRHFWLRCSRTMSMLEQRGDVRDWAPPDWHWEVLPSGTRSWWLPSAGDQL